LTSFKLHERLAEVIVNLEEENVEGADKSDELAPQKLPHQQNLVYLHQST
jgi:hypothetical protein